MANEETKKAESTEAPQTATAGTDAPQQDPTALSIDFSSNAIAGGFRRKCFLLSSFL